MKYCPQCQSGRFNQHHYCVKCGSKLSEAPTEGIPGNIVFVNHLDSSSSAEAILCGLCGTSNPIDNDFCYFCGTALKKKNSQSILAIIKPYWPLLVLLLVAISCLVIVSVGGTTYSALNRGKIAHISPTPTSATFSESTATATPLPKANPTPTETPESGVTKVAFFPSLTPTKPVVDPHPGPKGRIVYSCNDADGFAQICIIGGDGSDAYPITSFGSAASTYPMLSSDGKSLFFTSNKTGDHAIYEYNFDSKQFSQLTQQGGDKSFPMLSPDGQRIVYTDIADGTANVYLISRSGSEPIKLLTDASRAVWSEDGTKLAFICHPQNPQICISDSDGDNVEQITDLNDIGPWVSWAPDGQKLVFSQGKKADQARKICEIGVNRKDFHILFDKGDAIHPSYSPDGNWIVFTNYLYTSTKSKGEIFIMRKDGSDWKRLTDNDRADWLPFWGN